MSKQLSFWILLILIPLAFIKLTNPTSERAPTITYTQYDRELARGNIAKVTVEDGKAIVGEFRQPISVKGSDAKRFNVQLPVSNSDEELTRLRQANVEI
ncbi:MAG TPA: ATP-dependent metallopeptidase FtsH/Yme1/Tma family protein, partial [Gemmatimonadaceae bacterium]|nr:ATP-dependent metallopeptidase FtsH/Yme1/Tma family protein [Gemmatimonadaceae bacterium]